MSNILHFIFGSDGFMPHGHCYLWTPEILWLHVISDALITFAYCSIPVTLLYILRKRRDIPFDWVCMAFSIFIFACGATHLMEVWTIWIPTYGLSGILKAITAIASIVTATILVQLVPKILTWPSPQQLQTLNAELRQQNEALNRTNQQLADAQSQLLHAEKMASLGQLAAGVAHEINNPIGYIWSNFCSLQGYHQLYGELLDAYQAFDHPGGCTDAQHEHIAQIKHQMEYEFLRDDIPQLFNESIEGLNRVKKIIKDLKDFSHPDAQDRWECANLHDGIDSTLSIAWNEIKFKADVVKEYGTLPLVDCLLAQLNQVFLNILVNAVHAIEKHGTITIRTCCEQSMVIIEISDTGCGIEVKNLTRVFDPFFTTKDVGKGTGLGLSLSYGIVKKHGGTITVDSVIGKGTTFRIMLPVTRSV